MLTVRVLRRPGAERFTCWLCGERDARDGVSVVLCDGSREYGQVCAKCLSVGAEGAVERARAWAAALGDPDGVSRLAVADVLSGVLWPRPGDIVSVRGSGDGVSAVVVQERLL